MKWKRGASEFLPEKTFLIIKDDLEALEGKNRPNPRAKTKSAVSTGTWPPKAKKMPAFEEPERPKTANLDRPSILDPNLVDKLDMSLLSKELLCDSMTQIQRGGGRVLIGRSTSTGRRRQSVPVGERERHCSISTIGAVGEGTASNSGLLLLMRHKRQSFEPLTDTELCHVESAPDPASMKKQPRLSLPNSNDNMTNKRYGLERKRLDDNNNKKINGPASSGRIAALSTLKKRSPKNITVPSDVEVFTGPVKNAPEPCKTCGRPDQPERFHSHPKTGPVKVRDGLSNVKPKVSLPKTVQKPVALNYRSGKSKVKVKEVVGRKTKMPLTQERQSGISVPQLSPARRGPKTVACYICSREFGTASFPIHEPKCMQKWERENNSLPASQRRPVPQRPVLPLDHQDWNTVAWEQSQAQLIPCPKCGRTFLPDRLLVHQKSCKATPKCPESDAVKTNSFPRSGPPTIFCQVCGRNFGSRSIKIHESQCLKRWHAENDALSPNQRKKEPPKKVEIFAPSAQENVPINSSKEPPQKRTITCYICGRDFGSTSIVIHEPQCLKKWRFENDKLPPNQRRKEPQKPDIVFTRDSITGTTMVDHAAMAEANWRSHLGQLVPCKRCGRTFNPDRVAIHERSCKENR